MQAALPAAFVVSVNIEGLHITPVGLTSTGNLAQYLDGCIAAFIALTLTPTAEYELLDMFADCPIITFGPLENTFGPSWSFNKSEPKAWSLFLIHSYGLDALTISVNFGTA